jgi:hypothetical protein
VHITDLAPSACTVTRSGFTPPVVKNRERDEQSDSKKYREKLRKWVTANFVGPLSESAKLDMRKRSNALQPSQEEEGSSGDVAGREVERLMRKQVGDATRGRYVGRQAVFVCHLFDTYGVGGASVVREDFFSAAGALTRDGKAKYEFVRKGLAAYDDSCPPIDLKRLTVELVGEFIVKRNQVRTTKMVKSTLRGWVSAIKDLFRSYSVHKPEEFEDRIEKFVTGYAKDVATLRAKNAIGKEALPFELLCKLSKRMLKDKQREYVFTRTFLLLQWNLMCRSNNMETMMVTHLQWADDHMLVYFRKQKNDQDGSRSHEPRNVYANPVKPEICSILALGVYFLCYPLTKEQEALFPGHSQATRFNSSLARLLRSSDFEGTLAHYGLAPEDLGSHSLRKGSSTFVTSGTTDCPSQVAVNLRAGWTMNDVEKTYFRFEKAGDNFVGRTVAGLPIQSTEFAMLPPTFIEDDDAAVEHVKVLVQACFPGLPVSLFGVFKHILASAIWHAPWLRENLPSDHPLFSSVLFSSNNVSDLRDRVRCSLPRRDGDLQATGVPTNVSLKLQLDAMEENDVVILDAIDSFRTSFEQTLRAGLNDYALSQGHLTLDTLKQLLETQFASFDRKVQASLRQNAEVQEEPASPSQYVEAEGHGELYAWGGRLHIVPQDFTLPPVPASQAFMLWVSGSIEKKYPPLRLLSPTDMPTLNTRKRYSDLKTFMSVLESDAKRGRKACWPRLPSGAWKHSLTVAEARDVFKKVAGSVSISNSTNKGRKRRIEQLAWSSHFKEWKALQSLPQLDDDGDADVDDDDDDDNDDDENDDNDDNDNDEGYKKRQRLRTAPPDLLLRATPAHVRLPEANVSVAYGLLVTYCKDTLELEENVQVKGDGSCLFRVAAVQLRMACPELQHVTHQSIRRDCVEWVLGTYGQTDDVLLRVLGYDGWNGWSEQMSQREHYGDELCLEALIAVYDVRILFIFARSEVGHRFMGNANKLIYMACVGDYHFYSFGPRNDLLRIDNPESE